MSRRMVQLLINVAEHFEEKGYHMEDVRAAAKDYEQCAKELANEKGRYDNLAMAGWNLAQKVEESKDRLKAAVYVPLLGAADVYKFKYDQIYHPKICRNHGDSTFPVSIKGEMEQFCTYCGCIVREGETD